jgi:hypothetical protein
MHFIDIKPLNNKEIYKINTLLNMTVQFEAPHAKRDISQCMRCQKFGHTKNYRRNNPRCVKCAAEHLTNKCPRKVRDNNVKCVNCKEKHPANYTERMVNKQIQQKIYPRLRGQNIATRPIQSGVTYAQVVQRQTEIPPPPQNVTQLNPTPMTQSANDLTELKQIMKNLMDQMGTLINLIQ